MSKIYLISCVSKKRDAASAAADLYTSALFSKARALAEHDKASWYILSAQHGLLKPATVIEPYNETLNSMGIAHRREWASRVIQQMENELPCADEIVLLAGSKYREFILPWLQQRFTKVSIPMQGMGIGQQLRWLSHATTS